MKRYRYDTGCVIDQETGVMLSERKVVNRLNRLTEENEQLKQQLKELKE